MNSKLDVTVSVDMSLLAAAAPRAVQLPTNAAPPEARLPGQVSYETVQTRPSGNLLHESPPSSIFGTFRRWPLVPSIELCLLQAALTQCVELTSSESAHDLLTDVTVELERRTAETPPLPR